MIYIEKIKNIDCNNECIFYTSKYPFITKRDLLVYHSLT